MNSDSRRLLSFMEAITNKLANTFKEINELCNAQMTYLNRVDEGQPKLMEEYKYNLSLQRNEQEQSVSSKNSSMRNKKTKKIHKMVKNFKEIKESPKLSEDNDNEEGEPAEVIVKPKYKSNKKVKKISHKPKQPASSFLLFFKEQQQQIAKSFPSFGVTELTKVAAKCWNELSPEQKDPYVKMGDEERRNYQQKMTLYRVQYPDEIAEKEKDRKNMKIQKKAALQKYPETKKHQEEGKEHLQIQEHQKKKDKEETYLRKQSEQSASEQNSQIDSLEGNI